MSDDSQQPIVVKRIKKGGGGAHGGAWKIAYADFVTAMMAFFLLMWLLGSTAQGDLEGIADFFNTPLKIAMQGGSGSGDSASILQGGGEDLSRSVGQVRRGSVEQRTTVLLDTGKQRDRPSDRDADTEGLQKAERAERELLFDLKGQIEALVEASASLRQFKNQLVIDVIAEGLRIQIVDEQNRPMFDQSSADLKPYTRELLQAIGRTLNGVPNRISLTGHTDATKYAGGERGFSNWELSSNRANASRRELIAGGLDPGKVTRVVGLADTIPFVVDNPAAAQNRRISIVVVRRSAEEAAQDSTSMQLRGRGAVDSGEVERQVDQLGPRSAGESESPPPAAVRQSFRERYRALKGS